MGVLKSWSPDLSPKSWPSISHLLQSWLDLNWLVNCSPAHLESLRWGRQSYKGRIAYWRVTLHVFFLSYPKYPGFSFPSELWLLSNSSQCFVWKRSPGFHHKPNQEAPSTVSRAAHPSYNQIWVAQKTGKVHFTHDWGYSTKEDRKREADKITPANSLPFLTM